MCGLLFAALALGAAMQHPIAPAVAVGVLLGVLAWAAWRPGDLWFMLPALLPMANFMPWTGWWLVDESDLLVLAAMGGAYLRWGFDAWGHPAGEWDRTPQSIRWVYVLLPAVLVVGVWRGLDDARGGVPWRVLLSDLWGLGVYGDYDLPGNTLRVAKSLVWGLLLLPVLYRSGQGAPLRLARGMLAGLVLVCAVVLWERGVYAGGLDFSHHYRTSAWFWEMHVGGGAIDVYLALALPFAWWAAWTAPRGGRWCAAAALVFVSIYAVLTTYSRGVYLAVAIALVALTVLAHRYRFVSPDDSVWHRRAMAFLLAALVAEILVVLLGGSFMSDRLGKSGLDFSSRLAHWQRGIGLLQTPSQWALGLGIGRLPAHYSAHTAEGALPGQIRWVRGDGGGRSQVALHGPARPDVSGELALVQRVDLVPGGAYRVHLRARVESPARLVVQLCEQHLLYTFQCQRRVPHVLAPRDPADGWIELPLRGPAFASSGLRSTLRGGVFSIAVLEADAPVRLDAVELIDPRGRQVLKNQDFAQGPKYWSSIADGNFLPWHIDNLFLEILIERGLLGLFSLAAVGVGALVLVARGVVRQRRLALVIGISISAAFLVGAVVSFMEIPRVSFMLWLLLAVAPLTLDEQDGFIAQTRLSTSWPEHLAALKNVTYLRIGWRASSTLDFCNKANQSYEKSCLRGLVCKDILSKLLINKTIVLRRKTGERN